MSNLSEKHYVVFGGSSGIGKSISIGLSNCGASVTIVGKTKKHLDETFENLNTENVHQNHQKIQADLADLNDLKNIITTVGNVDGIIYSAGILKIKPLQFIDIPDFMELININSIAPVFLIKEAIKQRKISKGGSIVLIGSISGTKVGYVGSVAYSFSKGALSGMMKSLALELAPLRIRINSLLPAMVKGTNLNIKDEITVQEIENDKKKYPLGDYLNVSDVSNFTIFLLSDLSRNITGTEIVIDGGYTLN
jgi:NAD(P)-dependent dehydrogenase (short-subunit alcohol dehydrogenase family)